MDGHRYARLRRTEAARLRAAGGRGGPLEDGPLPTHYEPHESPFANPLYSRRENPARQQNSLPEDPSNPPGSPVYPYVVTTYRLTEHHTAGGMSRFTGYLAELQPAMFG